MITRFYRIGLVLFKWMQILDIFQPTQQLLYLSWLKKQKQVLKKTQIRGNLVFSSSSTCSKGPVGVRFPVLFQVRPNSWLSDVRSVAKPPFPPTPKTHLRLSIQPTTPLRYFILPKSIPQTFRLSRQPHSILFHLLL